MATSSTPKSMESTASNINKKKSDDVGWEFGVNVDPNNKEKIKCLLCGKVYTCGIYRFKHHIAGIKGNVGSCDKASDEDKLKCQLALDATKLKKKGKQVNEEALRSEVNIRDQTIFEDELEADFGELKSQRVHGPMDSYTTNVSDKEKGVQSNLNNVMRKEHMIRVKEYICRWAYECAIPFHAFERDSFTSLLEAVGQFGPRAQPPTRYEMAEPYLKKEVERIKNLLKRNEDEWKINGCSIMTDAWSDRKRRSIMNLCVNSKLGTVFLSSKECSNDAHTSEYIFEYVESCIVQVDPENVVQVVTDNASNNMGAAKLLKEKRPTIF